MVLVPWTSSSAQSAGGLLPPAQAAKKDWNEVEAGKEDSYHSLLWLLPGVPELGEGLSFEYLILEVNCALVWVDSLLLVSVSSFHKHSLNRHQ